MCLCMWMARRSRKVVVFALYCFRVFCFKQERAYERSISDWSSDVCSSDLGEAADRRREDGGQAGGGARDASRTARFLRHAARNAAGRLPQFGGERPRQAGAAADRKSVV